MLLGRGHHHRGLSGARHRRIYRPCAACGLHRLRPGGRRGDGAFRSAERRRRPSAVRRRRTIERPRPGHAPRWLSLSASSASPCFGHPGSSELRADGIWERDLSALSPVPERAPNVLDGAIRADLGAPDLRFLFLTSGDDAEAMLRASEALEPKTDLSVEGARARSAASMRFIAISRAWPRSRRTSRRPCPRRSAWSADLADGRGRRTGWIPALFSPLFWRPSRRAATLQPIAPGDDPFDLSGARRSGQSWLTLMVRT